MTTDTTGRNYVLGYEISVSPIPSMDVLIKVAGQPNGDQRVIALNECDEARDRIDVIFVDPEGTVMAIEGAITSDRDGALPVPPDVPKGSTKLAEVYVKAATPTLRQFDITTPTPSVNTPTEGHPSVSNSNGFVLDPNDPFDAILIPIVRLERKKRSDYGSDTNPFATIDWVASAMNMPGYTPFEDAFAMILRKVGRIANLRGREPENESLNNNVDDLITYAIILKSLLKRSEGLGGL